MKRFFLICLVVSLMLFTSCRGQDAKPLSEKTTSELKIMLDETWIYGEKTNLSWKAIAYYTKAIAIELELQRREK